MANEKPKWRLGEILIQNGWVTWEDLVKALEIQERSITDKSVDINMFSPGKKSMVRLNLGEILVRNKALSWENLERALAIQRHSGRILGEICIENKFIDEEALCRALALQGGYTYVDFNQIDISPDVIAMVPKRIVEEYQIIPVGKKGEKVMIVVADTRQVDFEVELQKLLSGYEIILAVSTAAGIREAIDQYYP